MCFGRFLLSFEERREEICGNGPVSKIKPYMELQWSREQNQAIHEAAYFRITKPQCRHYTPCIVWSCDAVSTLVMGGDEGPPAWERTIITRYC